MSKLDIPMHASKAELFKFLIENKSTLIAQKKAEVKEADGAIYGVAIDHTGASKTLGACKAEANGGTAVEEGTLRVKVVINTTNLLDSHGDVHIPKLWNKSLKENKNLLFAQEHNTRSFKHIIADGKDLKAYVKSYTWEELGYKNLDGSTDALVFEAVVREERNPEMYKQYLNGWVREHSVGMRYVKIELCVNSDAPEYKTERENWEKFRPYVANGAKADEQGYFWAVTEAKAVEGSAVPRGSNPMTPTLEVSGEEQKNISLLEEKIVTLETEIAALKGSSTRDDEPPAGTPGNEPQKRNIATLIYMNV